MNNNYFQPDISDIRVGYECQRLSCNKYDYASGGYSCDWEDYVVKELFLTAFKLRTLYLTKEQIKKENWEITSISDNKILAYWSTMGYCELIYDIETKHLIITDEVGMILYRGSCLSVNEFRYITKNLLNI